MHHPYQHKRTHENEDEIQVSSRKKQKLACRDDGGTENAELTPRLQYTTGDNDGIDDENNIVVSYPSVIEEVSDDEQRQNSIAHPENRPVGDFHNTNTDDAIHYLQGEKRVLHVMLPELDSHLRTIPQSTLPKNGTPKIEEIPYNPFALVPYSPPPLIVLDPPYDDDTEPIRDKSKNNFCNDEYGGAIDQGMFVEGDGRDGMNEMDNPVDVPMSSQLDIDTASGDGDENWVIHTAEPITSITTNGNDDAYGDPMEVL